MESLEQASDSSETTGDARSLIRSHGPGPSCAAWLSIAPRGLLVSMRHDPPHEGPRCVCMFGAYCPWYRQSRPEAVVVSMVMVFT